MRAWVKDHLTAGSPPPSLLLAFRTAEKSGQFFGLVLGQSDGHAGALKSRGIYSKFR